MNKKIFISMVAALMLLAVGVQAGNFTDNGNGTITDGANGLMWQKEDDNVQRTWADAVSYCEGLTLAGYSDWRLPNVNDLWSLKQPNDYTDPTIDETYFPNTDSIYWTSTSGGRTEEGGSVRITNDPSKAWVVVFSLGIALAGNKSEADHVRCVRGGR
ncbi:MAG: DUF1566 domain-containing protein [Desulfobacterales bacterium]|jgi:hypothetical protein|nr:DUF1566 domain-containing protein [Desulfobacterales bacterium]